MGRTVAVNPPTIPAQSAGVHFAYIARVAAAGTNNKWGYSCYDPITGTFPLGLGQIVVQDTAFAGIQGGRDPKIVVDPDGGKAILIGYDWGENIATYPDTFAVHVAFDSARMAGRFGTVSQGSRMPDSINQKGNFFTYWKSNNLWPRSDISIVGLDTIIYLTTQGGAYSLSDSYQTLKVFRKIGKAAPGIDNSWTLVYVDTGAGYDAADIACDQNSSRVGIGWTRYTGADVSLFDVWVATSPTGASGTWTATNLTNTTSSSLYRPWIEADVLMDSDGYLHVVWNTQDTLGLKVSSYCNKVLHWSERDPGNKHIVYDATYPSSSSCGMAGFNVNQAGRYSLAECEGRLYLTFYGANDPNLGLTDDCARNYTYYVHKGNAEIYLSISRDLTGSRWCKPLNLSNSYTPNCDSGNCASDIDASLSKFGTRDADYAGPVDWTNAVTYDPSGSYTGEYFLHLFYLTDRFPSRAYSTSTPTPRPWTLNDLRWIRLACAAPVIEPKLVVSPTSVGGYPNYVKPGQSKSLLLTLKNTGTDDLAFTAITAVEDSTVGVGGGSGWLAHDGGPAGIPMRDSSYLAVTVNSGGVITTGPTTIYGKIHFEYGTPTQTLDIPVQYIVADTIVYTSWFTLSTSCTDLAVGTNGNIGRDFYGEVNMDYYGHGDCTYGRGWRQVYLSDGSPVIIRNPNPSTYRGSWSLRTQAGEPSANAFKPVRGTGCAPSEFVATASYRRVFSGTMLTADSLVRVERTWWAPLHPDSCNFIVQRTQISPANTGNSVSGLQIGELIDFKIPSDSFYFYDVSGVDQTRRLIWAQGFNKLDIYNDCQDNSYRYGGIALLNTFMKDRSCDDALYGGLTASAQKYYYATGGMRADTISMLMHLPGYTTDPVVEEQIGILTFKDNYTLPANDTLTIVTALATVRTAASTAAGLDSLKAAIDKAATFAATTLGICGSCCQGTTGNVNMTGIVDLADLSALVSYLTGGGYVLTCQEEANINKTGIVDLADLSALVSYLTGGGFVLPNCS
ncbi:hypothetical protein C3F09_01540 [candidate division GN15 bacterium]|uniref:Dockerin domain-containing protein n=1 Tax=candidate division GN15 bacterium TaxID=2072418 RepID=A0A855XB93_9BACT|nr:MAG: hypothetical protein C3F09_01540 [candidate division GN15 bacterium]